MYVSIKNKLSILPFVIETDGMELIETWEAKELHIDTSYFYLLELEDKSKIWLNESLILPMFIKDKYVEKTVKEIFEMYKKDKSFEDVKVLKYHTNEGMPLTVKNKVMKELLKDFSFKFINIKKIKSIGEENSIRIDDVIKKFILIDQLLVLLPNMKSISSSRKKVLNNLIEKLKEAKLLSESKEIIEDLEELLKLENGNLGLFGLTKEEKLEKLKG